MRKRREHNCIFRRRLAAVLACMLALLCLCPAMAIDMIDEQASCTLTVLFTPGDGAQVKLYQVASMTGFGEFTPLGRFAELNENMNGLQDGEWNELARKLLSHADAANIKPMAEATVTKGKAVFTDLPVGLYLVTYGVYQRNNVYFITDPQLVSLPSHSNPDDPDVWNSNVTIHPKSQQIKSAPIRVQKVWVGTSTGDYQPVTIHLMVKKPGDSFSRIMETVVLSEANNWRAELQTRLGAGDTWSVVEATQLSGFLTPKWDWSWDGRNINVYVTNTKKPPYTPPKPGGPTPTPKPNYPPVLPQTGLLWWPVPLLAVGGMMLFGLGWIRRRSHD